MGDNMYLKWRHLMRRVQALAILVIALGYLMIHIVKGHVTGVYIIWEIVLLFLSCLYTYISFKNKTLINAYTLRNALKGIWLGLFIMLQFAYSDFTVFFSGLILVVVVHIMAYYSLKLIDEVKYSDLSIDLKYINDGYALHEMFFDKRGNPRDYQFIRVNKQYERLTGLDKTDIIGKTVLEVMPETEDYWLNFYGEVVSKKVEKSILQYSASLRKYFQVNAYPLDGNLFVTVCEDVTETMIQEKRLEFAAAQARKTDESKSQFLKDVNHRLRNPLNGMMGMAQIIDLSDPVEESQQLLIAMLREMKHMKNILDQVSSFLEVDNIKTDIEPAFILSDIEVVCKTMDKSPEIRCEIDESIMSMYCYDSNLFKVIMGKLLYNAYKYTRDDKVTLSLIYKEINNEVGHVYIAVSDNGSGIPVEIQGKILNEFYHHDFVNVYKEKEHISLALGKQMARKIGGDLCLDSYIGKGSKFTLILPVYMIALE